MTPKRERPATRRQPPRPKSHSGGRRSPSRQSRSWRSLVVAAGVALVSVVVVVAMIVYLGGLAEDDRVTEAESIPFTPPDELNGLFGARYVLSPEELTRIRVDVEVAS